MADYRQTVEEAARVLSLIHGEYAAALAYALRSGLAPALAGAAESMIAARARPLPAGSVLVVEARGEEPSTPLLDAARHIHETTGLLVIVTTPGRKVDALPVEEMRAHGWVPVAEVDRAREEERERIVAEARRELREWQQAKAAVDAPAGSVAGAYANGAVQAAADVLSALMALPTLPAPTTPTQAADAEPFCVCGRRASECDGSRAGCRTQCREEEASHD
jgi:hypothetical protein